MNVKWPQLLCKHKATKQQLHLADPALLKESPSLPRTLRSLINRPPTSTESLSLEILQRLAWTPLCGKILLSSSSYWTWPRPLGHPGPSVHAPRIFLCSHLPSAPHPPGTHSRAAETEGESREHESAFPKQKYLPCWTDTDKPITSHMTALLPLPSPLQISPPQARTDATRCALHFTITNSAVFSERHKKHIFYLNSQTKYIFSCIPCIFLYRLEHF